MTIIIFFIILALLIVSHEFGHFIVAKKLGIRVDEFGLGFPPKILSFKYGETLYTFNSVPFGGFVKIFGEEPNEESINGPDSARSMFNKPKAVQAAVLAAGVTFNILLAWLLLSLGFMIGLPTPVDGAPAGAKVENVKLLITNVLSDSPAAKAGLKAGDEIVSLDETTSLTPEIVQAFIAKYDQRAVKLSYRRGENLAEAEVTPMVEGNQVARIGIAMDEVGILRLPLFRALWAGATLTAHLVVGTAAALFDFIRTIFVGGGVALSQITGPVGLIALVGDASSLGFIYLLTFTAFISINLAIINLIPFPALDGGRLLFLLIEKLKGSPIKPKVANTLNYFGFALLIFLMLAVTYSDVLKLFR